MANGYGRSSSGTSRSRMRSSTNTTRRSTSANRTTTRNTSANRTTTSPVVSYASKKYPNNGKTSLDANHNHKYNRLDDRGNGWTQWSYHPDNRRIKHRHKILAGKVQEAHSECWHADITNIHSCESLYNISGAPPHIHTLLGHMNDRNINRLNQQKSANIVEKQREYSTGRTASKVQDTILRKVQQTPAKYYTVNGKPYFGKTIESPPNSGVYYSTKSGTLEGNRIELKKRQVESITQEIKQSTRQQRTEMSSIERRDKRNTTISAANPNQMEDQLSNCLNACPSGEGWTYGGTNAERLECIRGCNEKYPPNPSYY